MQQQQQNTGGFLDHIKLKRCLRTKICTDLIVIVSFTLSDMSMRRFFYHLFTKFKVQANLMAVSGQVIGYSLVKENRENI